MSQSQPEAIRVTANGPCWCAVGLDSRGPILPDVSQLPGSQAERSQSGCRGTGARHICSARAGLRVDVIGTWLACQVAKPQVAKPQASSLKPHRSAGETPGRGANRRRRACHHTLFSSHDTLHLARPCESRGSCRRRALGSEMRRCIPRCIACVRSDGALLCTCAARGTPILALGRGAGMLQFSHFDSLGRSTRWLARSLLSLMRSCGWVSAATVRVRVCVNARMRSAVRTMRKSGRHCRVAGQVLVRHTRPRDVIMPPRPCPRASLHAARRTPHAARSRSRSARATHPVSTFPLHHLCTSERRARICIPAFACGRAALSSLSLRSRAGSSPARWRSSPCVSVMGVERVERCTGRPGACAPVSTYALRPLPSVLSVLLPLSLPPGNPPESS